MDQQYFGVSLEKLLTSGGQTLYMVAWSLIIGTIIGIILALILVLWPQGRTCRESDSLQYRKYLH